jgi:hypothetical protein
MLPAESKPPKQVDVSGHKRAPDQCQPDWIVKKYFDPDAPRPSKKLSPSL